jgi:hypothetical protein
MTVINYFSPFPHHIVVHIYSASHSPSSSPPPSSVCPSQTRHTRGPCFPVCCYVSRLRTTWLRRRVVRGRHAEIYGRCARNGGWCCGCGVVKYGKVSGGSSHARSQVKQWNSTHGWRYTLSKMPMLNSNYCT